MQKNIASFELYIDLRNVYGKKKSSMMKFMGIIAKIFLKILTNRYSN